jgi:hypothetical protein
MRRATAVSEFQYLFALCLAMLYVHVCKDRFIYTSFFVVRLTRFRREMCRRYAICPVVTEADCGSVPVY